MTITVQCPFCGTAADIEEALLGKKLRCAEPHCRKAFRVTPAGEALPVIERGEKAAQPADWAAAPPPVAGEQADWLSAPPPVAGRRAAPTVPDAEGYDEPAWSAEPAGYAEPGYGEADYAGSEYAEAEPSYSGGQSYGDDYYGSYPSRSKKGKVIGIGIILVIAIGAIIGAVVLFTKTQSNKEALERTAVELLNRGDNVRAKEAFEKLALQFPNDASKYQFYQSWVALQLDLGSGGMDKMRSAEAALTNYFNTHRNTDAFREGNFRSKVWTTAIQIGDRAASEAAQAADGDLLAMAERMLDLAKETVSGEKDQAEADRKQQAISQKVQEAREAIATAQAARQLEAEIARVQQARQPQGIERVQQLYAKALEQHPNLAQQAELVAKLDQLRSAEPSWVTYRTINEEAERPGNEQEATSLLVTPPIKPAPATATAEGIVLAVARGTVYGLSAQDGKPQWAIRVGIDSQRLPARLPARRGQTDLALILSQDEDNQTVLNAIDASSGKRLWYRRLSAPCPAGPLLLGIRAYVPTLDGRLNVINVGDGKLIGAFETGARLTVPLGVDHKNNVLLVPADAKRIFAIDVAQNKCTDVFYTNHPAGLLRGAPVVAGHSRLSGSAGDAGAEGTFVIAEGTGMSGMKVRVFPTRGRGGDFKPIAEYSLPGQSWFTPWYDGDQLGLVTDKGFFALFGVNRETGDTDPLMPLVEMMIPGLLPPGTDLSNVQPKARSQVAFVGLGTWWLLVDNKLLHLRVDPFRKAIVPVPALTLDVGSPLHESTLSPDGRLVIMVTQSLDRRILATAVDRVTGTTVWQNQLGLVPTQDSVSLGDQVLTIDKSGALFAVDSRQVPPQLEVPWLSIGEWPAGNVRGMSLARLLPQPDGKAAIAMTYSSLTGQLLLRRFEPGRGITAERTYSLSSPPQGTPAIANDGTLVIPCRDGNLREFRVDRLAAGAPFTWRAPEASIDTSGHAVLVGDNDLFATDGLRRIQRWERTDGQTWTQVRAADLTIPARIVTPVLAVMDRDQPAVCVGDETGKIHVLSVGSLPSQREWETKGTISRGPFRIGENRVGCVVDRHRLTWFDVNGPDGQLLEFDSTTGGDAEAAIVGQPQAQGDLLLVPELSGRFTWLNVKTGEPAGPPVQLIGSLVPASGAVPIGAAHSFAPLSDGTVMLVPLPKN